MNYKRKILRLIETGALMADNSKIEALKETARQQMEKLQANLINECFEQRLKTEDQINELKEEVLFYVTILESSPIVNYNEKQ